MSPKTPRHRFRSPQASARAHEHLAPKLTDKISGRTSTGEVEMKALSAELETAFAENEGTMRLRRIPWPRNKSLPAWRQPQSSSAR
jgi:hypothetical protein